MGGDAGVRTLFGMTLAFHIVYATLGVGLPLFIALAEILALRRADPLYRLMARRWAAVFAVFLATGVVTGTIVAFQLQLLWPAFMRLAGQVIALPFAIEVFAFFIEAVFTAVYLHAADRIAPVLRIASALLVAVAAAASALLITDVNAFMNTPTGFRVQAGRLVDIHPFQAMLNPAMPSELAHVLVTAYLAVALVMAAFAARALLRGGDPVEVAYHRRELDLAMALAVPAWVLTAVTGDWAGKFLDKAEPIKFAAQEGLFRTSAPATLVVGGYADAATASVRGGIPIPHLLSILATSSWSGSVKGLLAFPRASWPPVAAVHLLFDAMVGVGVLAGLAVVGYWWVRWRARAGYGLPPQLLGGLVAMGPVAMVGIETGWIFAELGRQPWTIEGVLTTAQAATTYPHAGLLLLPFALLYGLLGAGSVLAVTVHRRRHPLSESLREGGVAGARGGGREG